MSGKERKKERAKQGESNKKERGRRNAEVFFFSGYLTLLALHQHIVQLLKATINEVFRDL